MRYARSALIQTIAQNKRIWEKPQKEKAEEDKKAMTLEIDNLVKEKKQLEKSIAACAAVVNDKKAVLKDEEKKFTQKEWWLRAEIETYYLKVYGIDKGLIMGVTCKAQQ